MNYSLDKIYSDEYEEVIKLCNHNELKEKRDRLNTIYNQSENYWHAYLDLIHNKEIKYLLIAEAPPWSETGEVVYVLNPKSKARSLLSAISKAFFDDNIYKKIGVSETLKKLACNNFTIIDSLAFALPYKNKRNRKSYKKLVELSCGSYLLRKINENNIKWDRDLKIAFSVKRNATLIIDKFSDGLFFEYLGKSLKVNDKNIAVNNAWYPDSNRLKKIFAL